MNRVLERRKVVLLLGLVGAAAVVLAWSSMRAHIDPHKVALAGVQGSLQPPLRPLTGSEEVFAAALWPIHREVNMAAMRMSFAGITYKSQDHDAADLRAVLAPIAEQLDRAATQAAGLTVPDSMTALREQFVGAVRLYRSAAGEMLAAADNGSDELLLLGQGQSLQASEEILRVGDQLWPTEHKPH